MSAHDDLQALRRALVAAQRRVYAAVAKEFQDLHAEFDITPEAVTVDIFEVTTIGATEKEHVVGEVRFRVTL